jgi:hypothetical protein
VFEEATMRYLLKFFIFCAVAAIASCGTQSENNSLVMGTISLEPIAHICIHNDTLVRTEVFVNGESVSVDPSETTRFETQINGHFVVQMNTKQFEGPQATPNWIEVTVHDGWLRGCNVQNTVRLYSTKKEYADLNIVRGDARAAF